MSSKSAEEKQQLSPVTSSPDTTKLVLKDGPTKENGNQKTPSAMDSAAATNWKIPLYLALNALSSIGIVLTNKLVFQTYEFRYGTFITFLHFVTTFVCLEICRQFGMFELKMVRIAQVLPLVASFCGFVVLTNLSLLYNSVGFYQIMKVLTTPIIVVIETFFFNETYGLRIKSSLGLTCVGVIIATASDTEANLVGTIFALSALLITSMYQIWVKTKQKELEVNSFQLLYYQAPLSALLLIPIIPVFDDVPKMYNAGMPESGALVAIFISCLLAFLVNLSTFLVIGQTSPVTYNVLGHFKLTVILSLGFIFFGSAMNVKILAGIATTLAGVFWYTHLKQNGVK